MNQSKLTVCICPTFSGEIYSYDDPPSGLSNKICLTFWHLSKEVRSVLTSPAWKDRIKKSEFPFFCMNNGLCKYFDNKNSLDQHYIKNPSHRNVNFSKCKEEAARRVQLRHGLVYKWTELLLIFFSWSAHMRREFENQITPWGWLFWTIIFYNLKNSSQDPYNEGSNFILISLEFGLWVAPT